MRRTQGFDYRVARRRAAFSLKLLLEHRLIVCFGCSQRVSAFQLIPQRITDKTSRCFETAVEKYRSRDRFKHVSQQCVLMAPAALLFTPSETKEVAEVQLLRSLGQRRRTDKAMLHSRQLAFSPAGIRAAQVICYYQTKNRVADKLE